MQEAMQRSQADFKVIDEQYEKDKQNVNSMALVPITEEDLKRQRKQNRDLLKMKAKMASTGNPKNNGDKSKSTTGRVFYDADANAANAAADNGTFVTGLGIPGNPKNDDYILSNNNGEETKYYNYPEEELIEKVDRFEADMKDMM